MTIERYNRIKAKYPDILDGAQVSLYRVGDYLAMVNMLEKNGDLSMISALGLQNYKSDLNWILGNIKQERKEKLKKLNENI